MDDNDEVHEVDLREYLRVLRRRYLVVVITILVLVGAAVGYSVTRTKVYSARAQVLVPQISPLNQLSVQSSAAQINAQSAQRTMENEVRFAQSDAVTAAAQRLLGRTAKVSVASDANADVLKLTARSTSPKQAAEVANAFAQSYIAERRQSQVDNYNTLVSALNAAGQKSGQDQTTLQAATQVAAQSGATLIDRAKTPTTPVSPKPLRNALIAAIIGLLAGIGLAFVIDRLDESIKSKHDLEAVSGGVPSIGLIPEVDGWRDRTEPHVITLESPRSPAAESYRTLRTSVQFMGIDRPMAVIGVTSSNAAEGKTTTLANLAVSYAKSGKRVAMVCCDLRKPRIHTFFGKSNEVGLTSVLLGDANVTEAFQAVTEQSRLGLLASGPPPPNPAEILTLPRVEQLLTSLLRFVDVVLIDCPPVLPVADTLLISKFVDGMVLVAQARKTSRRDLHRALELLRQVDAPLIGTVLNSVSARGGYDYGYGGYGGYSYGETTAGGSSALAERAQRRRARRQRFEHIIDSSTTEADEARQPGHESEPAR